MKNRLFANPVAMSHDIISKVVKKGDSVVDATAGNGKDTIFLAELVGSGGRVYAFDLQEEAVAETEKVLQQAGLSERVEIFRKGHEEMGRFVTNRVRAVMFNLGYLPGGDKRLITRPSTTVAALKASLELLIPGGLVTLVVYRGHSGGREESYSIKAFVQRLSQEKWDVVACEFPNRKEEASYLLCIQSRVVKT